MQKLLIELKTMLENQISLHEGLKTDLVSESEQDGALSGTDFLQLQRRKYYWAAQIEEAESHRISQVRELAGHWNLEGKDIRLKDIISRSPASIGEELSANRETLIALVSEIRALARETGSNASARLKAVDAALLVVGEAARQHPTYSGKGRIRQKPPTFKSTSA